MSETFILYRQAGKQTLLLLGRIVLLMEIYRLSISFLLGYH